MTFAKSRGVLLFEIKPTGFFWRFYGIYFKEILGRNGLKRLPNRNDVPLSTVVTLHHMQAGTNIAV